MEDKTPAFRGNRLNAYKRQAEINNQKKEKPDESKKSPRKTKQETQKKIEKTEHNQKKKIQGRTATSTPIPSLQETSFRPKNILPEKERKGRGSRINSVFISAGSQSITEPLAFDRKQ